MAEQSGKMSKGCLVAIIVVSVILLLVIIAGVTCYVYREDIAKGTASVLINKVKEDVAKQPPEGVDTVQFNAIADGFKEDLDKTKLDAEKFRNFMADAQRISGKETLTATDISQFEDAMIAYFPDLAELKQPVEPQDTTMMHDTTTMQDTTSQ